MPEIAAFRGVELSLSALRPAACVLLTSDSFVILYHDFLVSFHIMISLHFFHRYAILVREERKRSL